MLIADVKINAEKLLAFKCNFCILNFPTQEDCDTHVLTHFTQNICKLCDKLLLQIGSNWYQLDLHTHETAAVYEIHEQPKLQTHTETVKIEQYDVTAAEMDYESAGVPHAETQLTDCVISSGHDASQDPIANEMKMETKSQETDDDSNLLELIGTQKEKLYICDHHHDIKFKLKGDLRDHMRTVHVMPIRANQVKPYHCGKCDIHFRQIQTLKAHLKRKHNNEIGMKRDLMCNYCGKIFKSWETLVAHKNEHISKYKTDNSIYKFKCSKCQEAFKLEETLNTHMSIVHENVKNNGRRKGSPYQCNQCEATFICKKFLISHAYRHSRETEFSCTACGAEYNCRNAFFRHLRIHSGWKDKRFPCDQCEKTFARPNWLNDHKQQVHLGKILYQCEVCSIVCRTKQALQIHEVTHKPKNFVCDVCGERFHRKQTLKFHKGLHLEIKPYPCAHCDSAFTRRDHWRRHQHIHSKKKPFPCNVTGCGRGYMNQSDLLQHQYDVHKIALKNGGFTCGVCSKVFVLNCLLKKHSRCHM